MSQKLPGINPDPTHPRPPAPPSPPPAPTRGLVVVGISPEEHRRLRAVEQAFLQLRAEQRPYARLRRYCIEQMVAAGTSRAEADAMIARDVETAMQPFLLRKT